MDRTQLFLLGLPLFLFCSDLVNLFAPPPPKPYHPHHPHPHPHRPKPPPPPHTPETLEIPSQKASDLGGIGLGSTVNINFCTSCSYKGNALTIKKMLETAFPGIDVILANYPPPLPKRLLAKVVPVVQFGALSFIVAGEQLFPMLGMAPPPLYFSLRANRFGSIASIWLLGNMMQSFLQSSGAFEVYCNDELVFSKLKEGRFPGEIELKELVRTTLAKSSITGNNWE